MTYQDASHQEDFKNCWEDVEDQSCQEAIYSPVYTIQQAKQTLAVAGKTVVLLGF